MWEKFAPLRIGHMIRRMRSGCRRIVNGFLREMSELITQHRIVRKGRDGREREVAPPNICLWYLCNKGTYRQSQKMLTRMWVNAQRDGRPAGHRWRPLFNAAVWLTLTTWLPCRNAAKTRKPLKLAGVPQTNETISAASRPKFTILWARVEEILLLNPMGGE